MKLLVLFLATAFQVSTSVGGRGISTYWAALETTRSIGEARALPMPVNSSVGRDADIAAAMLKFREYELTYDRTNALVAVKQLERVVARTPKDPWAHFALGVALARGPDTRQRPYAERNVYVVHSTETLAVRHAPQELRRALALDPTLAVAAQELGQFAIDLVDAEMMREALQHLSGKDMPQTSGALMLQSKLQQRLGQSSASRKLADDAEDAGADPSLAAYQRSETMFRAGLFGKPRTGADQSADARSSAATIESAASEYFGGLSVLTPAGADLYYSTIDLLLTPAESEQWRKATLTERARWLRNFWDVRAALAGVTVPARLAEHFRRLAQLDPYRSPKSSATPTMQELRGRTQPKLAEQIPQILNVIRHGDGSRREKYLYCEPGWDTLPVPMQPSLRTCMTSPYAASRYMSHGTCPPLSTISWVHPDSMMKFLECKSKGGLPDEMDLVAMRGNRYAAAKRSVRGETFYPAYARPVAMTWEAIQFHGPGIGAEVVAAFAVPQPSFSALDDGHGALTALVSLALADTINGSITRTQKTVSIPTQQVAGATHVLMHASTTAQAASNVALRIRVENSDGSAGAIAYGDIDIEAFDDDSLTMSDIVLAPTDGFGTFKRGDVMLTLAPGRTFARSEAPTIYYEVYGTTPDSRLTTEIRVEAVRGSVNRIIDRIARDPQALTVRFEEPPARPVPQFGVQLTRSVDLASLPPGEYRMTVSVTDALSGRTATRGRLLTITP